MANAPKPEYEIVKSDDYGYSGPVVGPNELRALLMQEFDHYYTLPRNMAADGKYIVEDEYSSFGAYLEEVANEICDAVSDAESEEIDREEAEEAVSSNEGDRRNGCTDGLILSGEDPFEDVEDTDDDADDPDESCEELGADSAARLFWVGRMICVDNPETTENPHGHGWFKVADVKLENGKLYVCGETTAWFSGKLIRGVE
jgi:hypothetical protein